MNIYQTEAVGDYEFSLSIELDSDKENEINFAKEILFAKNKKCKYDECNSELNPLCPLKCNA